MPRIRDTRWPRISPANIGPNLFHQCRTVSWQISIPRSRWLTKDNSHDNEFEELMARYVETMAVSNAPTENIGRPGCWPRPRRWR
jgi:hypothetical protein